MFNELEKYATAIGANQEIKNWIHTTGKKALKTQKATYEELESVIDYLMSSAAPARMQKLSITDALKKAKAWSESSQKKGRNLVDSSEDLQLIHDFLDGTKIVKLLTKKALQREGHLMAHCVGGYTLSENLEIYSYRDSKNMPHATFEVQKKSNEIVQIKGKGNRSIHPKYIHPILAFLESVGQKIRPVDMRNLGYYHIDKQFLQKLDLWPDMKKRIVVIKGETYAF